MADSVGPVIVLPGLMGSQLQWLTGPNVGEVLWAESLYLAQPQLVQELMLAPNGRDPYPDYGLRFSTKDVVAPYYTEWLATLKGQEAKEGFGPTVQMAWDWRRSLLDTVNSLAGLIAVVGKDAPVNLVGHSAGGLLARLAWAKLVDDNQTALVRRIVTLGTPHWGSFEAMTALCGFESFYDRFMWVALFGWHRKLPTTPYGDVRTTGDFWASIGGTWPGLYQLLPAPDETTEEGRKLANLIYTATNYPTSRFLSQDHMDTARRTVWARLKDPKYAVPVDRLKCLVGTGSRTQAALGPVTIPFGRDAFAQGPDEDGDGVVTVTSQILPGAGQFAATAGHREEPGGFSINRMIANALTAADVMTIAPKGLAPAVLASQNPPVPFQKPSADQPLATIQFGSNPPWKAAVGDP